MNFHATYLHRHSPALVLICILTGLTACQPDLPRDVATAYRSLPEDVDFNFDVRPVLSDRCFACHGPDANAREADLRLDTEEGAKEWALEEGGYAIVAGDVEQSAMIERILHTNAEEVMPPAESNLSLSAREKAILIKWIEQGAEWKKTLGIHRPGAFCTSHCAKSILGH